MSFKILCQRIDWSLLLPAFFLTLLGLLSIFSSSFSRGDFLSFEKQIFFLVIALVIVALLSLMDLVFLRVNSRLIMTLYLFSVTTLAGLFLFGQRIRGARSWYKLGFFSFAPVSFVAIILILVLSKYFSARHIEIQRFRPIIISGLFALLPMVLVLLQPDLGSALTLLVIWAGMLIFSGIKLRHFFVLLLLFLILAGLGWQFWLQNYQKQRILSFLNPTLDQRGISWNLNQSKIAIGSGGFLGKGFGHGSQTQYGFLPEAKTDFIFSAIAEEFGFLMICFLVVALFFLCWRTLRIALWAQSNFLRLFAFGFCFLILSQSFINIGMCLGLLPVVGIPLPFVSYSGSQLLSFYLGLGILMSLEKRG